MVYDNWILHVVHFDILKANVLCVAMPSLLIMGNKSSSASDMFLHVTVCKHEQYYFHHQALARVNYQKKKKYPMAIGLC